jgi:methylated-DNA-protein-cysteine methyltransferase-like protein
MPHSEFTENILNVIRSIPEGKVCTYGLIARLAGNPRGARQVSWTLHSMTMKYDLPWYRVVNSKGTLSVTEIDGKAYQKHLLEQEGVEVSDNYEVDLDKYLWKGEATSSI